MIRHRPPAGTPSLAAAILAASMLLTLLVAPTTAILSRLAEQARRLREDERGDIVQNILWVAGFAAIAIVVIAIIRNFVIAEAENLPTSGNIGN